MGPARPEARPTTVAIVPHTHWDREWYLPFQVFRIRLVTLLDRLLPLLESDLSYARFLLDGQTAVLDDYLAVRPEAAARLERLATSGRLQVGPWMILMDEFMVSGETLVRDLQLGMTRATALGGAMQVGYLPDMFGHVAQMPQLLASAGLEHAVMWRGVPSAVTQTAFWWDAPDGSRVRAEYLYGSYSNGRDLPDDAKALVTRAHGYEIELGAARLADGGMLLMNGTDHQLPQPWLGRVVAEANEIQDDYRFVVTSLPEYLAEQPTAGLTTWPGELRSGARANVLMGVASNRVDVHQLCAAAERALERRAEPLSALLRPPDEYPAALLGVAWRQVVLNSAHDSSCACSDDEVVEAVRVRYQEARQIGDTLVPRGAARAGAPGRRGAGCDAGREPDPPRPRRFGRGCRRGRRPGASRGRRRDAVRDPGDVGARHGGLRGDRDRREGPLGARLDPRGRVRRRRGSPRSPVGRSGPTTGSSRSAPCTRARRRSISSRRGEELLALGAAGATVRFKQELAPTRGVLFAASPIAGFGWGTYEVAAGEGPATAVTASDGRLENEQLVVTVDAGDGRVAVETRDGVRVAGVRLVDGGDGGDTYNYSPPGVDRIVDAPETVVVSVVEPGPARAALEVTATYVWPAAAVGDMRSCERRTDETVRCTVRTRLELRAAEPFVRVHAEIDNHARDHRLRVHCPLPTPVTGSEAECAFAVVHRGLTAEGGPHEAGLPTWVSRRFVDCSDGTAGLAVLHDGLLEYEVVEDGRELAVTLLRAVGYLSRVEPALRPNPAGPMDALEGAQLQGRRHVDYALLPHRGDWQAADLYAAADAFLVPLERARVAATTGDLPGAGQALRVDGAEVSAVTREPGGLTARVFNASPAPSTVTVDQDGGPASGWIVDLLGRPLEPFDGGFPLRAWGIATVRLTP